MTVHNIFLFSKFVSLNLSLDKFSDLVLSCSKEQDFSFLYDKKT